MDVTETTHKVRLFKSLANTAYNFLHYTVSKKKLRHFIFAITLPN